MSTSPSKSDNNVHIKYSYKPVPTIRKFSESNAFMRALMGPFGSGKSSGCVVEMVARALAQNPGPDGIRRSRWAVVRNTYKQLSDTTIRTVHQWLPPQHFGEMKVSDNRFIVNVFEGVELEFLFRALDRVDHIQNLLSMELTGAWLNEAREVPWAVVEAIQGRVGRYPAVKDGGCKWYGVIMDTNPPDTDSKFFKYWEETKHDRSYAEIFKQPSGLSPEAENLDNLPGRRKYYENLAVGKDPEWAKVYIHGDYGFTIDGRPVFLEYNDTAHCGECKPVSYAPVIRGWDFGLTPACVFAQMTSNGQLIVFDEMVSESMGIDQFSDEVIAHCSQHYPDFDWEDVGDPAGEQRSQTDEKTCFQILHSKGINIEGGIQSMAIRLESVRRPLTRLVMGKPGFRLHPRCKTLRKGFMGGYQYRRLQTAAEKFTSVPDKDNMYSHPMDGLEYICTKLFGAGLTKPKGFVVEEETFGNFERNDCTGY